MKSNAKRKQQKAAEMFQRNENFLEKLLSRKAEKSQTHTHKTKDSQSLFDAHSGAIKAIISFPTRKPKHRIGFAFSFPFLWGGCVQRCWRIYALKKRDGNNLLFQITCNECNCKTFFVSFRFVKFDLRKKKKSCKKWIIPFASKTTKFPKEHRCSILTQYCARKRNQRKKTWKRNPKEINSFFNGNFWKEEVKKKTRKRTPTAHFQFFASFFSAFRLGSARREKKRLLTSPRYAWFFPRSIHFTRNPPNGYTQQKQTQEEGKTVFKMLLKVFFEVSRCPDVMTEWHFLIVPVCLPRLQNGNLCESSSNRDRFPQARRGRAVEKPRDYHIQQFIKIVNLFRLEKKYFFSGLQRLRFGIIETEVFYKKNLQQKILQRKKFFFYFLLPFLLEDFFQTLIQNKRSEATHKKHLFPAYSWPRLHWLFYACRM